MGILEDFRALAEAADDEAEKTKPLPEAQIAVLRELQQAHAIGREAFRVGDIITVRAGVNVKGAGKPAIVIEIGDGTAIYDPQHYGGTPFGSRRDVRAISLSQGQYVAHWHEAWTLIPYTGPGING